MGAGTGQGLSTAEPEPEREARFFPLTRSDQGAGGSDLWGSRGPSSNLSPFTCWLCVLDKRLNLCEPPNGELLPWGAAVRTQ